MFVNSSYDRLLNLPEGLPELFNGNRLWVVGRPIKCSLEVYTGEFPDPIGGFFTALYFLLSSYFEAFDLILTMLLCVPHIRCQIVQEETKRSGEKA